MHSHEFKLMSISNHIPFRVSGHCQSVLRWYLTLTFDMKIILTDLPNVRVFLTLQTSGNGKLTPVGKHDKFAYHQRNRLRDL